MAGKGLHDIPAEKVYWAYKDLEEADARIRAHTEINESEIERFKVELDG
jgi:hypothetical protein